ncbi:hypothetical protein V8C42DRAFT_330851 [Trichoderma barbatum]
MDAIIMAGCCCSLGRVSACCNSSRSYDMQHTTSMLLAACASRGFMFPRLSTLLSPLLEAAQHPAQTQNPVFLISPPHSPVAIAFFWTVVRHLRPRPVVETTKEQLEGQAVVSCRCTVQLRGTGTG